MCDKYSNKLKKNQEKYKYFSLNYQLVTNYKLQSGSILVPFFIAIVTYQCCFVDAKRPQAVTDMVSVFEETRIKAIR